jgi:hypothetical protein
MITWTRTREGQGADLHAEDIHAEEKDGAWALWRIPLDGDPVMLTERLSAHDGGHPIRVYDDEDRIVGWEWDVYDNQEDEDEEFDPQAAGLSAATAAIGSAFEMLGQVFGFQMGRIATAIEAIQATLEHAYGKVYPEGTSLEEVKAQHEEHKRPVVSGYYGVLVQQQLQALAVQQEAMQRGVIQGITSNYGRRRNQ